MKTIYRMAAGLLTGVFLMMLAGCATVPTVTTPSLTAPTYPPTDPTQVAILSTEPTRPCVRLGQIRAEPESVNIPVAEIKTALQKAAAKLGADAVVIIHDQDQVVGAIVTGPWYDRSLDQIQGRVIVGVAIKYTPAAP